LPDHAHVAILILFSEKAKPNADPIISRFEQRRFFLLRAEKIFFKFFPTLNKVQAQRSKYNFAYVHLYHRKLFPIPYGKNQSSAAIYLSHSTPDDHCANFGPHNGP
jgi:hypothetical protein